MSKDLTHHKAGTLSGTTFVSAHGSTNPDVTPDQIRDFISKMEFFGGTVNATARRHGELGVMIFADTEGEESYNCDDLLYVRGFRNDGRGLFAGSIFDYLIDIDSQMQTVQVRLMKCKFGTGTDVEDLGVIAEDKLNAQSVVPTHVLESVFVDLCQKLDMDPAIIHYAAEENVNPQNPMTHIAVTLYNVLR